LFIVFERCINLLSKADAKAGYSLTKHGMQILIVASFSFRYSFSQNITG
jgi:hypothetical protein